CACPIRPRGPRPASVRAARACVSSSFVAASSQSARSSFDYVVVGAGSAGSVVAARGDATVALLEAGGPYRRLLDVPLLGLWAWLRRPQAYCWSHVTTPQPGL